MAAPDALEQVIALRDDALVSLDGSQVLPVHLRYEDVHVAPSEAGRAVCYVEVLRAEHDGVNLADEFGRAAGNAVDPHILLDVQARLPVDAERLVEGVLEIDLDADGTVLSLDYRGHMREELDSHRLATYEFTFGRSSLGLGYDEEIQGFEEVALAVPVVALNEHHPRPQFDLQPLVVSNVEQRYLGEMYIWAS